MAARAIPKINFFIKYEVVGRQWFFDGTEQILADEQEKLVKEL